MKRCTAFLLVGLFGIGTVCFAEKLAVLPGLVKPSELTVDAEQFYVVEGAAVSIYSLKNFKLKKRFGKSGEGPGEFKLPPGDDGLKVKPCDDYLLMNSMGKISFFSKDGNFQKEMMTRVPNIIGFFQPMGRGFTGLSVVYEEKTRSRFAAINLYDEALTKIKEIHRQRFIRRGVLEFPMVFPLFLTYDNKILLGGEKGFVIQIFDGEGRKITTVKREYNQLEVTNTYKKNIHRYFRTTPPLSKNYQELKEKITFSEYFPAILLFYAADNRIYILTYLEKDEQYETFVYGMDGRFIKSLFLPLTYKYGLEISPHYFKNNRFYQLVENEKTEQWELHAERIE